MLLGLERQFHPLELMTKTDAVRALQQPRAQSGVHSIGGARMLFVSLPCTRLTPCPSFVFVSVVRFLMQEHYHGGHGWDTEVTASRMFTNPKVKRIILCLPFVSVPSVVRLLSDTR